MDEQTMTLILLLNANVTCPKTHKKTYYFWWKILPLHLLFNCILSRDNSFLREIIHLLEIDVLIDFKTLCQLTFDLDNMKSIAILAVLLAYFACSSASPTEKNPKVCLESDACYAGSWKETRRGVRFASFQEIHYAQVCLPSQFDSDGFLQLRVM